MAAIVKTASLVSLLLIKSNQRIEVIRLNINIKEFFLFTKKYKRCQWNPWKRKKKTPLKRHHIGTVSQWWTDLCWPFRHCDTWRNLILWWKWWREVNWGQGDKSYEIPINNQDNMSEFSAQEDFSPVCYQQNNSDTQWTITLYPDDAQWLYNTI